MREQIEVTLNVANVVVAGPTLSQIAAGLQGFLHSIAAFSWIYREWNPERGKYPVSRAGENALLMSGVRGQSGQTGRQTAGRRRRQNITTGCKQSLQTGHFIRQ